MSVNLTGESEYSYGYNSPESVEARVRYNPEPGLVVTALRAGARATDELARFTFASPQNFMITSIAVAGAAQLYSRLPDCTIL